MTVSRRFLSLALLLLALPALAQPARVGPLGIQNNLSEILANGSGAQLSARANLGLGLIAIQDPGAVVITGGTVGGLSSLGVTGNGTVGGTLGVTGAATFSGNLSVTNGFLTTGSNSAVSPFLFINGTAANQRGVRFLAAGVDRWRLIAANAEGGSNSGSDLIIQSVPDAGTPQATLTQWTRSTGAFVHNATGLFHYTSTGNVNSDTGFVGWLNQTAGRRGKIGLTGQASNNGYVYTPVPAWVTGTPYLTGAAVAVGYNIMTATGGGTSGGTPPSCSVTVSTCSDGAVTWAYESIVSGDYQLVGGFMSANMTTGFGGAPGGTIGTVFGFNTQANISVANANGVVGYENNFGLGFPARARIGEQIIAGVAGTNQGSDDDIGWRIGSQQLPGGGGAAPLRDLMNWGGRTSQTIIDANGYGLRAWSGGWNNGGGPTMMVGAGAIDMTEFQATGVGRFGGGFILRGPGSQILASGDIQSNNALLHKTSAGASLDVSQYRASAVAVHAGGGGTTWSTSGWLADCTDGSVVQVTSVSGGAVTGVSLFYAAFGPAPVATVTCSSEQYVGPIDTTGTPTLPDTIQVDETWVLANAGSPVLALGGTASVQISPSAGPTTVGGTLGVTGATTLSGTLGVTGDATLSGAGTGLAVTNNATVGGTLGVTGAGTIGGQLNVTGSGGFGVISTLNTLLLKSGSTGSNGLVQAFAALTAPKLSTTGAIAFSGAPSTNNAGAHFSSTMTGSLTTGQQPFVSVQIQNDAVAQTNISSDVQGIGILHTVAAGATGNRWMVDISSATTVATTDLHLGGYRSTITTSANMGGTGTTAVTANGNLFGANFVVQAFSGATDLAGVAGQEVDVEMRSGSSAYAKAGLAIVQLANDGVQGSVDDQALSFNNQAAPTAGQAWLSLIGVGRNGGFAPLDPTNGWIMTVTAHLGAGSVAAAGGLDFTNLTPATAFMRGNGFLLDPSGVMTASAYKAGANAGVSCAAASVNLTTLVVSSGIVTHC